MPQTFLEPEFLARLEQLELTSRKILAGRLKGERRSKRRGTSVEFADHREYVVGDDLRHIDWNIMIRLDRLFIKLFEEEEDLHFHIVLDASRSMDFGSPTKLEYCKKVAAALAFVGLINLDRVVISTFSDSLSASSRPARGRTSLLRVFDFLEKIAPDGGSDFGESLKTFAIRNSGKGVVVLLSDLLDKNGFDRGMKYLLAKQMDIYVIHVMAAEEIDPELTGDLKLVDSEDGDETDVTISAPLLAKYKANAAAFQQASRDYCTRRGISYLFTTNQAPFDRLVLTYLRNRGLVR